MKKCPVCRMTVDADDACPFCGTTLTYEARVLAERERIVPNRYYWRYLVKTLWFSAVCVVFCAVRILLTGPTLSPIFWYAVLCGLASVILSLGQRRWSRAIRWKYSAEYSVFRVSLWRYLLGGMAVLFACFL